MDLSKKRAKPRRDYEPTQDERDAVTRMIGFGFTHANIAAVLGLGLDLFRKSFSREIECGSTVVNMKVANKLYQATQRRDSAGVTAAIYWTKARMGWKERSVTELVGEDGDDIKTITRVIVDPKEE